MPLYEIYHSTPLTTIQKSHLAQSITSLHSTTFRTPSLFVNLRFVAPEPAGDYFVAGKPTQPTSPNRIVAMVRTGGPGRSKEIFDEVARKIEGIWEDVVVNTDGGEKGRKLHFIVFTTILAAVENGVVIPGAGEEGTWLKSNMAYFRERAEVGKDEHFRDMLKEIEEREDLKSLVL
ncbi:hypothetical protein DTO166G4_5566 [Paecilomyces variotii]|nr:hypothetical protein DTO166G4_5566 [Paecilomyces variotii]KAJ9228899.1 hypothetical protein DTO166G5_8233 [Paecilomyces variotii]KAJ9250776.1 hypothetical protein DTO207G8_5768 [Paecilomyces variotii]KAJ9265110.1 hypothetical protein DTO195F2_2122 [Paecilomyces variotii]KAJ9377203.1 hypothetical protein DTO063F5_8349 [Paecilomyces variotii]